MTVIHFNEFNQLPQNALCKTCDTGDLYNAKDLLGPVYVPPGPGRGGGGGGGGGGGSGAAVAAAAEVMTLAAAALAATVM